ncbi:MAG: hypothetical protein IT353_14125 [Gemmatimonadaceae bacterium]|nr:hypothetical protein [Gemmatimonadaceae bacterium]
MTSLQLISMGIPLRLFALLNLVSLHSSFSSSEVNLKRATMEFQYAYHYVTNGCLNAYPEQTRHRWVPVINNVSASSRAYQDQLQGVALNARVSVETLRVDVHRPYAIVLAKKISTCLMSTGERRKIASFKFFFADKTQDALAEMIREKKMYPEIESITVYEQI